MKISIQLRKFGKSGQAKVYYRLRDGKTDMKAASSMSIQPEFWDNVNHCYKMNEAFLAQKDTFLYFHHSFNSNVIGQFVEPSTSSNISESMILSASELLKRK